MFLMNQTRHTPNNLPRAHALRRAAHFVGSLLEPRAGRELREHNSRYARSLRTMDENIAWGEHDARKAANDHLPVGKVLGIEQPTPAEPERKTDPYADSPAILGNPGAMTHYRNIHAPGSAPVPPTFIEQQPNQHDPAGLVLGLNHGNRPQ